MSTGWSNWFEGGGGGGRWSTSRLRASDSGARGRCSILTRVAVLCPLVMHRKRWLRPDTTEKWFT